MFDPWLKRISAGALGLLALGVFAGMEWQQEPGTQDPIRTGALELTNTEGAVVAQLSAALDAGERVVTAYHKDGRKAWQGRFAEGKREGPWIVWDRDAEWIQLGDFEDDAKTGLWRRFSALDIQVLEECHYVDGLREGLWSSWFDPEWAYDEFENRLDPTPLESRGTYLEGKRHGIWTSWYLNGQKSAEGEYRDGLMAGRWTVWDRDGRVLEKESGFYENGVKIR